MTPPTSPDECPVEAEEAARQSYMVHFEEIDEGNWRIPLNVSESQKKYVANTTVTLARAYAYRGSRSRAYLIFDGDTAVGMVLYHDCDPMDAFDFSQLLIDERYQGRGYGKEATKAVLDMMRQDGKYQKVVLCYIDGNETAKNMYEKFGFREIDRDEDEIVMELML